MLFRSNRNSSPWMSVQRERQLETSTSTGSAYPTKAGDVQASSLNVSCHSTIEMLQPEGDDGSPGPEANTLATASDTEADIGFNAGSEERSRENAPSTNDEFSRLFLEEDPFASRSHTEQEVSNPVPPRRTRPRGLRPLSIHSSTNLDSRQERRPHLTIGIPSSSDRSSPSPSSRMSTRSPRIRYPQSALASIPEHQRLNDFPPTGSRFPYSAARTSPLSLHRSQHHSRPRSRSDGGDYRSPGSGRGGARDGGRGRRAEVASFIDVSFPIIWHGRNRN